MSEYDQLVEDFKRNCKATQYAEHKKIALKKSDKKKVKHVIRQANQKLHHMVHGRELQPYGYSNPVGSRGTVEYDETTANRIRVPSSMTTDMESRELDLIEWIPDMDDDWQSDNVSLPGTVIEEFSRFGTQMKRLTKQYDEGTIGVLEFTEGMKSFTEAVEKDRQYEDLEEGGTSMSFEPRKPDTAQPASSRNRPMGRIETPEVSSAMQPETPMASQEMPY